MEANVAAHPAGWHEHDGLPDWPGRLRVVRQHGAHGGPPANAAAQHGPPLQPGPGPVGRQQRPRLDVPDLPHPGSAERSLDGSSTPACRPGCHSAPQRREPGRRARRRLLLRGCCTPRCVRDGFWVVCKGHSIVDPSTSEVGLCGAETRFPGGSNTGFGSLGTTVGGSPAAVKGPLVASQRALRRSPAVTTDLSHRSDRCR